MSGTTIKQSSDAAITRGLSAIALLLAMSLAACARLFYFPPASPADYPCGYSGRVCGAMCCSYEEACGGEPGCPAGLCCFVGETISYTERQWQSSGEGATK